MPRKKNTSALKQKKQITSRLMQISLIIDDYIYKGKPISEYEANSHIKEVESYKSSCRNDERSLQVIEKISRCMKSIIREHQESRVQESNRSPSPVYSICDEDRTQIEERNTEPSKRDDNVIDLTEMNEDLVPRDEIVQNNADLDIQRAISHLSIQDAHEFSNNLDSTSRNDTSSPSLLNNFDSINITEPFFSITDNVTNNKNITSLAVDNTKPSEPIPITNNTNVQKQDNFLNKPLKINKPIFIRLNNKHVIKPQFVIQSVDLTQEKINYIESMPNNGIKTTDENMINERHVFKENNNFNINSQPNVPTAMIINKPTNIHSIALNDQPTHNIINNTSLPQTCTTNVNTNILAYKVKENIPPHSMERSQTSLKDHNAHKSIINTILNMNNSVQTIAYPENNTDNINISHSAKFKPPYCNLNSNITQALNSNTIIQANVAKNNEKVKLINVIDNQKPKVYNNKTNVIKTDGNVTKKKRQRTKKIEPTLKTIPKAKSFTNNKKEYKQNTVKGRKKQNVLPIYNANVENDLSWLESIRFVREVKPEENVSSLLHMEDSFWENCSLPADWDDNEFLYST